MTPEALAELHARCFSQPPPWSARAFAAFLADPNVILLDDPQARGFVLTRIVLDEAELLTIAVDPGFRRRGIARDLLDLFDRSLPPRGVRRAFLEVAASNHPARALYAASGWRPVGERRGYYRAQGQAPVDALLLSKALGAAVA